MQRDSQLEFCTNGRLDTASAAGVEPLPARWGVRRTAMLLVLLAAPAVAVIDGFIAVVALPSIQRDLRASDAGAQLIIAGYSLAYAALLITAGRLGDVYGRRRLLVIGLTTFGWTSLVAGFAPNEYVLVAARFTQGGAAALMYPQALGQLRAVYSGRDRDVAVGAYGVALGLAAIVAPIIGGLLIQADMFGLGWRSIFLVNVPVTMVAAALASRVLPARGRVQGGPGVSLDLVGLAILTPGLLLAVVPLVVGGQVGWPSWTWAGLASALLAAAAFVVHERRTSSPLLDLDLFRERAFGFGLLATLPFYAGEVSYLVLLTIYLQRGMGMRPMAAGLMVTSVAVGFSMASATLPFIAPRLGRGIPTWGTATVAVSTSALIGLVLANGSIPPVVLASVLWVTGVGFGLTIPSLVAMSLDGVPQRCATAGAGILVTAQQMSGALGVAVAGKVFFSLLPTASIRSAYAWALGLDLAMFIVAAALVQVVGDGR